MIEPIVNVLYAGHCRVFKTLRTSAMLTKVKCWNPALLESGVPWKLLVETTMSDDVTSPSSGSLDSSLEELMTQVDESFGHSSSFVEETQEGVSSPERNQEQGSMKWNLRSQSGKRKESPGSSTTPQPVGSKSVVTRKSLIGGKNTLGKKPLRFSGCGRTWSWSPCRCRCRCQRWRSRSWSLSVPVSAVEEPAMVLVEEILAQVKEPELGPGLPPVVESLLVLVLAVEEPAVALLEEILAQVKEPELGPGLPPVVECLSVPVSAAEEPAVALVEEILAQVKEPELGPGLPWVPVPVPVPAVELLE